MSENMAHHVSATTSRWAYWSGLDDAARWLPGLRVGISIKAITNPVSQPLLVHAWTQIQGDWAQSYIYHRIGSALDFSTVMDDLVTKIMLTRLDMYTWRCHVPRFPVWHRLPKGLQQRVLDVLLGHLPSCCLFHHGKSAAAAHCDRYRIQGS